MSKLKSQDIKSSVDVFKLLNSLSYILLLLMLLIAVFLGIQLYKRAPNASLYIHPEGLSVAQYKSVNDALKSNTWGSFFKSDLQKINHVVASLSWINQVDVTRDWKKGISIQVLPRKPIANFGSERLVDANGKVYSPADELLLQNNNLATLQGAESQAVVIMQQMQQVNHWFEPLDMSVEDIILTSRRTWIIKFDSGLRLVVDDKNTAQKIINARDIFQQQLKTRLKDIQVADLRYQNGFAISWKVAS